MNNTVNNISNPSFNARYLRIKNPERIPQNILDAIYKSDAIDNFLIAGKPKTIWGKIIDIFRTNEFLDINYEVSKIKFPVDCESSKYNSLAARTIYDRLRDPYQKVTTLIFKVTKGIKERKFELYTEQCGVKRQAGSVPKKGEHYLYKPPLMKSEEELAKKVQELKDIDTLLR